MHVSVCGRGHRLKGLICRQVGPDDSLPGSVGCSQSLSITWHFLNTMLDNVTSALTLLLMTQKRPASGQLLLCSNCLEAW
jgi:hypothetical protein